MKAEARGSRSARADQRLCWAELLRRVFRVEGWQCPHCGKPMKPRSIVIREPATTQVLTGLSKATGPPGRAERRGPGGVAQRARAGPERASVRAARRSRCYASA